MLSYLYLHACMASLQGIIGEEKKNCYRKNNNYWNHIMHIPKQLT